MSPAVLGVAWAAIVVAAAWRWRPLPGRDRAAALRGGAMGRSRRRHGRRLAGALGAAIRRVAGRSPDADAARRLGWVVLLGVPVAVLAPPAGLAVALAAWAVPVMRARRQARRRAAEVIGALPEVVDLFVVAVGAGLTVALAVRAVGERAPPPFAAVLADVGREAALGRRLADLLDEVPGVRGEPVRPLTAALAASERYGAPLVAGLDRLADEVRRDRRRRAEDAARKVPVKLLFPLVFCVLPAFALLTLAPPLVGALRGLRL